MVAVVALIALNKNQGVVVADGHAVAALALEAYGHEELFFLGTFYNADIVTHILLTVTDHNIVKTLFSENRPQNI